MKSSAAHINKTKSKIRALQVRSINKECISHEEITGCLDQSLSCIDNLESDLQTAKDYLRDALKRSQNALDLFYRV